MKLSISNIAWPIEKEQEYLPLIRSLGCTGVEIAPSKIWAEPIDSNKSERRDYKKSIEAAGLEISAMQALLYTKQKLGLFRTSDIEKETINYLKELCLLAKDLSIPVLVFGSPRSRMHHLPVTIAFQKAVDFFSEIGEFAEKLNVCVCIEPLSKQETNFITTLQEGANLVNAVDSAGFKLHVDSKALSTEQTDFLSTISLVATKIRHYHISEPNLTEINTTGQVNHKLFGAILNKINYPYYVSVEMKTLLNCHAAITRSLKFAKEVYTT